MAHAPDPIAEDIDAYLAQQERKELLRFLTCGSVDDGKSTLIGRLLHDSQMLYEDQLEAVRRDSARTGTQGGEVDFALLVDGLQAEREQGITIDVAYRYFSTRRRKFVIADTPGHVQYTRNMVTGASNCDVAVILIDARAGVLTQTRRHTFLVTLLGIRHVIVAVNKMDLVDWSEARFEEIRAQYLEFATDLDIDDLQFIPMSALSGDNVVEPSTRMPWYGGTTLMYLLETVPVASNRNHTDFRFPVQWVNRPNANYRGFSGTIASGTVQVGDEVLVLPSRRRSRIEAIDTFDGTLPSASTPMAVTLRLEDQVDVGRGDMIVDAHNAPELRDRFDATLVWMVDEALQPGGRYLIKHAHRQTVARIEAIRYRVDVDTLEHQVVPRLGLNEIGRCELALAEPIPVDPYTMNRATGAFIVIDRLSNMTVAAGMIRAHDAGADDRWESAPKTDRALHESLVGVPERAARLGQQPVTVLLTGLNGSGKTTLATAAERRLFDLGHHAVVLDGQSLRLGVNRDIGFSRAERSENLRRGAEIARLMNEAGLIVLCAYVAPDDGPRRHAAETVGEDRFLTVHVDAPVEVCRARDAQGLFAAADRGEIADFPGVSAPYEAPSAPDLRIDAASTSVDEAVEALVTLLRDRGVLTPPA